MNNTSNFKKYSLKTSKGRPSGIRVEGYSFLNRKPPAQPKRTPTAPNLKDPPPIVSLATKDKWNYLSQIAGGNFDNIDTPTVDPAIDPAILAPTEKEATPNADPDADNNAADPAEFTDTHANPNADPASPMQFDPAIENSNKNPKTIEKDPINSNPTDEASPDSKPAAVATNSSKSIISNDANGTANSGSDDEESRALIDTDNVNKYATALSSDEYLSDAIAEAEIDSDSEKTTTDDEKSADDPSSITEFSKTANAIKTPARHRANHSGFKNASNLLKLPPASQQMTNQGPNKPPDAILMPPPVPNPFRAGHQNMTIVNNINNNVSNEEEEEEIVEIFTAGNLQISTEQPTTTTPQVIPKNLFQSQGASNPSVTFLLEKTSKFEHANTNLAQRLKSLQINDTDEFGKLLLRTARQQSEFFQGHLLDKQRTEQILKDASEKDKFPKSIGCNSSLKSRGPVHPSNATQAKEFQRRFDETLLQTKQTCSALIVGLRRLEISHNITEFRKQTVEKLIELSANITNLVMSHTAPQAHFNTLPDEFRSQDIINAMAHYPIVTLLSCPPNLEFKKGMKWFFFLDENWQESDVTNPFAPANYKTMISDIDSRVIPSTSIDLADLETEFTSLSEEVKKPFLLVKEILSEIIPNILWLYALDIQRFETYKIAQATQAASKSATDTHKATKATQEALDQVMTTPENLINLLEERIKKQKQKPQQKVSAKTNKKQQTDEKNKKQKSNEKSSSQKRKKTQKSANLKKQKTEESLSKEIEKELKDLRELKKRTEDLLLNSSTKKGQGGTKTDTPKNKTGKKNKNKQQQKNGKENSQKQKSKKKGKRGKQPKQAQEESSSDEN
jgi:hypothetical protein